MKNHSTVNKILALAAHQAGIVAVNTLFKRNYVRSKTDLADLLDRQLAGLVECVPNGRGRHLRLTPAGWQRSGSLDASGRPIQGITLDLRTLLNQLETLSAQDQQAAEVWHAIRDYHHVLAELDAPPSINGVVEELKTIWQTDPSRAARKLARKTLKRLAPYALGEHKDMRLKDQWCDPPPPPDKPHKIHKRTPEDLARFIGHLRRTGQQDVPEPLFAPVRPSPAQRPPEPPPVPRPYEDDEDDYHGTLCRTLKPGGKH